MSRKGPSVIGTGDAPDRRLFVSGPGGLVTLHLTSHGRWIAESVPVEDVRNHDDGTFEVDLRIANRAWLRHLLLQAADAVLHVRPADVAADVSALARTALDAYGPLAD